MGFTLNISIPALTVLAQGLLSFFSPCVLPLLPVYFGFLSGGATAEEKPNRAKTLVNTVCFVLGISFAFFLLALGMTAFGSFFQSRQTFIAGIGGVLVILLGLYQTGLLGTSALLSREARFPFRLDRAASSPLTALLLGFVFSFSWTPCVGPALSSVLLMAASSPSRGWGFFLIGVYTLGFAVPFLATGIFTTSLLQLFHKHRSAVRFTEKAGGILLVLMGLFMLTGGMNRISASTAGTQTAVPNAVFEEAEADGDTVRYDAEDSREQIESGGGEQAENDAQKQAEDGQKQTEDVQEQAEDGAANPAAAVDFELTDQYGTVHRLSDYKGQVVFLNFWATWCPPCRAEMPAIQSIYEQTQNGWDDVAVIGVASPNLGSETSEEGIREFLEENGYTYPVVMDTTGELFAAYGISAIPTTFMIDREGNVFGYVPGSMTEEVMHSIIDQTLNASP
ncbi:MAG: redoxin domain-containing protein [Oscillibacter sp.]|nr:redoxin domain-containing protein [Oscillibacter sp.]